MPALPHHLVTPAQPPRELTLASDPAAGMAGMVPSGSTPEGKAQRGQRQALFSARTRADGHELEHKKLCLNVRKDFCDGWVMVRCNTLPREAVEASKILLGDQKPSGCGPGPPDRGEPT